MYQVFLTPLPPHLSQFSLRESLGLGGRGYGGFFLKTPHLWGEKAVFPNCEK